MSVEFEFAYKDLTFSGYVENNILTCKNIKMTDGKNLSTSYEGAKYVFNLIKEKAEKELQDYIKQNLNNYDIYVKNNNHFMNFNYYTFGKAPAAAIYPSMEFINLLECTVKLETDFNHSIIEYDLLKDKIISCKSGYSDKDIPLMNAFFKPESELAYAQYKKSIAPPIYTEIARLRRFIEEKQSMQVYIDKKPYKVKGPFSVSSFLFFSKEDNEFYFNNSRMTPNFSKSRIPLNEIQYLKFNREEYYFDLEKLSMNEANLTRPGKEQIFA